MFTHKAGELAKIMVTYISNFNLPAKRAANLSASLLVYEKRICLYKVWFYTYLCINCGRIEYYDLE